MDSTRFDDHIRKLGKERFGRRAMLAFGLVTGLGAALGHDEPAEAGVGCLNINQRCKRHRQCCSGRCLGKKGKKRCRGHHAGTCPKGANFCTEGYSSACNGNANCFCHRTTGGARFCGSAVVAQYRACRRDTDCVAQGFPKGSACVDLRTGQFCEIARNQLYVTACMAPCGTPEDFPLPPQE